MLEATLRHIILALHLFSHDPEAHLCLTQNIYWEARGEPPLGQIAVAWVTLNRVKSPRWPDHVCDVVTQPHQFSWTSSPSTPSDEEAYEQAVLIAASVLAGQIPDPTGGATHYYAHNYAHPRWASKLTPTAVIGGHTFMKEETRP